MHYLSSIPLRSISRFKILELILALTDGFLYQHYRMYHENINNIGSSVTGVIKSLLDMITLWKSDIIFVTHLGYVNYLKPGLFNLNLIGNWKIRFSSGMLLVWIVSYIVIFIASKSDQNHLCKIQIRIQFCTWNASGFLDFQIAFTIQITSFLSPQVESVTSLFSEGITLSCNLFYCLSMHNTLWKKI